MESNVYYELGQTKMALDAAERMIRRQKGKLFGKNLLIAGSLWLFWETVKMLEKSHQKLKEEKQRADEAEVALVEAKMRYDELLRKEAVDENKDVCCDGKASVTKKDV